MATTNVPGDGSFFATVPLEAEDHAATVEVIDRMVQLALLGPVVTTRTTLTRAEARDVAHRLIEASQTIWEEER